MYSQRSYDVVISNALVAIYCPRGATCRTYTHSTTRELIQPVDHEIMSRFPMLQVKQPLRGLGGRDALRYYGLRA